MADKKRQRRTRQLTLVQAIDLERFAGTPLGDIEIGCRACAASLTATDKLCMINREYTVWYKKGRFTAFCEVCCSAVVV